MHSALSHPFVLLFALVVLTPGAVRGQYRTSVLSQPVEPRKSLLQGETIQRDSDVPLPITILADRRPWWVRHPVQAGAVAGGAVGLGISLARAVANDFRCPAEFMFPCWWDVPVLTVSGAALGALVGLIVSGPPPHAAQDPTGGRALTRTRRAH